jgi:hypothetical protein
MIATDSWHPACSFAWLMKQKNTLLRVLAVGAAIIVLPGSMLETTIGQQKSETKVVVSANQKKTIAAFNKHVKDYVKQRNRVKEKVPKISKDATPEQIQAFQKAFVEALKAARAGAKPGYIFSPDVAEYMRTIIKTEFKGRDRAELRETVLEAETKGVPIKVNYPYPDSKEVTQMPPTLLLKLPQLPKEVRYRFVRWHLLLVDTDNDLIVDYMLNALP